ncbi:hypothetical protein [Streptomyces sp. NPDC005507]|uniref:hypothetical protein n=1 Tax=unclassified Streptomyces TaxID=2593676 RepID=UPI00339DFFFF
MLDCRIDDLDILSTELSAWQNATNTDQCQVDWQFTTHDACIKLLAGFVDLRGQRLPTVSRGSWSSTGSGMWMRNDSTTSMRTWDGQQPEGRLAVEAGSGEASTFLISGGRVREHTP